MLYPKIFTYTLNAYLDAQIAEEIVAYIKRGEKLFTTGKSVAKQRAENLIATANSTRIENNVSYLIGLAYTQYYLNGLADILYAHFLWSFVISKQKFQLKQRYKESITNFRKQLTTPYQFEELIYKPGIVLWYWPLVISDPWRWASTFAKTRCG